MKSTELRIGNLILVNDIPKPLTIQMLYDGGLTEYCKPIPLTEEWLLNFGFKKYSKNFIKYGNIEFYIWEIDNSYKIKALDILIKIQTVHELQNLYFLLTKTELFYE